METTSHAEHPRKRFTEEMRSLVLRDYLAAGDKIEAIAKLYGVSLSYPSMLARRAGIARRAWGSMTQPNSEPARFGNPGSLPKERAG